MEVFWPRLGREEAIRLLRERVPGLAAEMPLVRAVLFGSYAKGNYAVGSDLDLLVVYQGEKREDAYVLTRQLLDIPGLEPHVYAEREYGQMRTTLDRMCEPGIVLYPERAAGA